MWFYIEIRQNQQFAFFVMRDVWYGRLELYTLYTTIKSKDTNST